MKCPPCMARPSSADLFHAISMTLRAGPLRRAQHLWPVPWLQTAWQFPGLEVSLGRRLPTPLIHRLLPAFRRQGRRPRGQMHRVYLSPQARILVSVTPGPCSTRGSSSLGQSCPSEAGKNYRVPGQLCREVSLRGPVFLEFEFRFTQDDVQRPAIAVRGEIHVLSRDGATKSAQVHRGEPSPKARDGSSLRKNSNSCYSVHGERSR